MSAACNTHTPTLDPNATNPLLGLPTELHYKIFDLLDPIDSTCLGLTAWHFYRVFRHMYDKVPLSCGRVGPNDMEWAWGQLLNLLPDFSDTYMEYSCLALKEKLATTDGPYCRHCGIYRCELYMHLKGWMNGHGKPLEYCSVTEKFGSLAENKACAYCYYCNPKKRQQCGRHYNRWMKGNA